MTQNRLHHPLHNVSLDFTSCTMEIIRKKGAKILESVKVGSITQLHPSAKLKKDKNVCQARL